MDGSRIGSRRKEELALEVPFGATIDQIGPWVKVTIRHGSVSGYVGLPLARVVSQEKADHPVHRR